MNDSKFLKELSKLHIWHYERCKEFKTLVDFYGWNKLIKNNPEDIYIHTNLFKIKKIISSNIETSEELLLQSSGTSSNSRSKIYSDRLTRINQQRALIKIVSENLKISVKNRLNFYIVSKKFSNKIDIFDAQKAAILGFSMFSRKNTFLLKENNEISEENLEIMINDKNPYVIFGFTSDIYLKFISYLRINGIKIESKNNFLIHGGGWKKLINYGISNEELNFEIQKYLPEINCKNYYGMIEQTGSIFMECEHGYFHTNEFADIVVRDNNFKKQSYGKEGFIQSISLLPKSYPGHSLITEDIGICFPENTCKCGLKGKFFKVKGRLNKSELRGCSDVY